MKIAQKPITEIDHIIKLTFWKPCNELNIDNNECNINNSLIMNNFIPQIYNYSSYKKQILFFILLMKC
jgi:hypothetical protein